MVSCKGSGMELDLSNRHVRRRMRLRGIDEYMAQLVVDEPDTLTIGRYGNLYDRMVEGHLLRVVLVPGTNPGIVKTVMWRPDRPR